MPLTSFTADAFGVLTICLVALLSLLGLLCIGYSVYFRSRVRDQGFAQLSYFSGPWIIRITFVLSVIWWGLGEIARLTWLRRGPGQGQGPRWQGAVCKGYIVSSLGFAEPCLLLTVLFLLRAPLQRTGSGILGHSWNGRTAGLVLLYCLPVFVLQLLLILVGPHLSKSEGLERVPHYFTSATHRSGGADLCTYPLTSTILHGVFATVLTLYLTWLGRRILKLVINKGLQRRVYALVFSVSGFFPLRVLLLGFSVMSKPDHFRFEALSFSAFLSLLCCAGVCICVLVYFPIADSLALVTSQDLEGRRVIGDPDGDQNDSVSLIANRSHVEGSVVTVSPERNSDASTKRGSISFRTFQKEGSSRGNFVELSLFSPSRDGSPPGSPPLLGWPMHPAAQYRGM